MISSRSEIWEVVSVILEVSFLAKVEVSET